MGTGNQREHQRAHPRLLSEEDRLHARAGCGDCRSGVCFEHETEKTAQVEDTFRSLEWCTSRLNVPMKEENEPRHCHDCNLLTLCVADFRLLSEEPQKFFHR